MTYQIVLSSSEYRQEINGRKQTITVEIPRHIIRDTLPDRIVDLILVCERDEVEEWKWK